MNESETYFLISLLGRKGRFRFSNILILKAYFFRLRPQNRSIGMDAILVDPLISSKNQIKTKRSRSGSIKSLIFTKKSLSFKLITFIHLQYYQPALSKSNIQSLQSVPSQDPVTVYRKFNAINSINQHAAHSNYPGCHSRC